MNAGSVSGLRITPVRSTGPLAPMPMPRSRRPAVSPVSWSVRKAPISAAVPAAGVGTVIRPDHFPGSLVEKDEPAPGAAEIDPQHKPRLSSAFLVIRWWW